jgi:hypothetical protein
MFAMSRMMTLVVVWIGVFGLTIASASAQTSMQRRAAEESAQAEEPSGEAQPAVQQEEPAAPRTEPEVEPEDRGPRVFHPYSVHKPGIRLDLGFGDGIDRVRFGVGLGYMYALGWEIVVLEEVVAVLRGGVGPDITLLVDSEGFNGFAAFVTGRANAIGIRAGGLGLELAGGGGIGRGGIAPAVRLGIYYSGRYFEAGYFYQFVPLFRTEWMAPHNIGLRLHIPVLRN